MAETLMLASYEMPFVSFMLILVCLRRGMCRQRGYDERTQKNAGMSVRRSEWISLFYERCFVWGESKQKHAARVPNPR